MIFSRNGRLIVRNGNDAVKVVIVRGDGGQIERVVANADLDVILIDLDVEGADDDEIQELNGREVFVRYPESELNVDLVEKVFSSCS